MRNNDIQVYSKQKGVRLWEVAEALGYSHESKLSRRLRHVLEVGQKQEIFAAIDSVVAGRGS